MEKNGSKQKKMTTDESNDDDDDDNIWDAFGSSSSSDDEEMKNVDGNSTTATTRTTIAIANTVAQQLVRHFLQQNSRVPLSERVVGILKTTTRGEEDQDNEEENNEEKEEAIRKIWKQAFHERGGVQVVVIVNSSSSSSSSNGHNNSSSPFSSSSTTTTTTASKQQQELDYYSYYYDAVIWLDSFSLTRNHYEPPVICNNDENDNNNNNNNMCRFLQQRAILAQTCRRIIPGGCFVLHSNRKWYTWLIDGISSTVIDNNVDDIDDPALKERFPILDDKVWKLEERHQQQLLSEEGEHDDHRLPLLRIISRRTCPIQHEMCPWLKKSSSSSFQKKSKKPPFSNEYQLLEQATPVISLWERQGQQKQQQQQRQQKHGLVFTETTIQRAVKSIQCTGYCILSGILDPNECCSIGNAAIHDVYNAINILRNPKKTHQNQKQHDHDLPVDLLHPGSSISSTTTNTSGSSENSGQQQEQQTQQQEEQEEQYHEPASYRELSMREDFRMDLRHGPALCRAREQRQWDSSGGHLIDEDDDRSNNNNKQTKSTQQEENEGKLALVHQSRILTAQDHSTCEFLRGNADILEICRRVMNPVAATNKDSLSVGNMGRYNFNGSGPDGSYQDIRVGPVGAIISLPGAADQAIHADTPHLFEHTPCLPAHYINVFTPGCWPNDKIGQTALVHGSHSLAVTAQYNSLQQHQNNDNNSGHHEMLQKLLVRPQLQPGDVLIFDCRILHFGLSNNSTANTNDAATTTTSTGGERPMLYCNISMHWFHDPKNWDNERPIFEDNDYK